MASDDDEEFAIEVEDEIISSPESEDEDDFRSRRGKTAAKAKPSTAASRAPVSSRAKGKAAVGGKMDYDFGNDDDDEDDEPGIFSRRAAASTSSRVGSSSLALSSRTFQSGSAASSSSSSSSRRPVIDDDEEELTEASGMLTASSRFTGTQPSIQLPSGAAGLVGSKKRPLTSTFDSTSVAPVVPVAASKPKNKRDLLKGWD